MMEAAFVKTALDRVDAPQILSALQSALENEKNERQHFYKTLDENRKMEFINGKIVFQSPVMKRHNFATAKLFKLVDTHADRHNLGFTGIEKILVSLTRNDYEPDVCFWQEKRAAAFREEQMQFPAPDFVAEVLSKSTEKHDRNTKFEDYALHGVPEYWIVSPEHKSIEQYKLVRGKYELIFKASDGYIKSFTIKDFEIPVKAVFDKKANMKALLEIMNQ